MALYSVRQKKKRIGGEDKKDMVKLIAISTLCPSFILSSLILAGKVSIYAPFMYQFAIAAMICCSIAILFCILMTIVAMLFKDCSIDPVYENIGKGFGVIGGLCAAFQTVFLFSSLITAASYGALLSASFIVPCVFSIGACLLFGSSIKFIIGLLWPSETPAAAYDDAKRLEAFKALTSEKKRELILEKAEKVLKKKNFTYTGLSFELALVCFQELLIGQCPLEEDQTNKILADRLTETFDNYKCLKGFLNYSFSAKDGVPYYTGLKVSDLLSHCLCLFMCQMNLKGRSVLTNADVEKVIEDIVTRVAPKV